MSENKFYVTGFEKLDDPEDEKLSNSPVLNFNAPEQIKTPEDAVEKLWWVPRKEDILKILTLAKEVHAAKHQSVEHNSVIWILDVGGRSGFIDKLLIDAAREEGLKLKAIIVDPDDKIINEAKEFYKYKDEEDISFIAMTADEAAQNSEIRGINFDLVINSYMPANIDLGKDIRRISALARVYIGPKDAEAAGTSDAYIPGKNFKRFAEWPMLDWLSFQSLRLPNELQDRQRTDGLVEIQVQEGFSSQFEGNLMYKISRIDQSTANKDAYPWQKGIRQVRSLTRYNNFTRG